MAIWIDEAMSFAGAAGPRLSRAECTWLMVSFAIALPATELVLPLNDHACHSSCVAFLDAALLLRSLRDSCAKDKAAALALPHDSSPMPSADRPAGLWKNYACDGFGRAHGC